MKNWAVTIAIALGLVGYRAATEASRDESGAIVDAGTLDAFEMRIGDCFDDTSGLSGDGDDNIENLPGVPCSDPHDNEVFAVFDLDLEAFPEDDEMSQIAFDACVERFESFVGMDYQSSSLDVMTLYPTPQSWKHGNDREVVCAVYDMEANKLVGSAKGKRI